MIGRRLLPAIVLLGDAQVFVDLVDNPRYDGQYAVFGQLLNGIDVVDAILEGDVIERIEILSR